jgi:hypothetical protein
MEIPYSQGGVHGDLIVCDWMDYSNFIRLVSPKEAETLWLPTRRNSLIHTAREYLCREDVLSFRFACRDE